MTIQRMDNVGIVVDDLKAATAFFVELGLDRRAGGADRLSARNALVDVVFVALWIDSSFSD
jgi:catechol 2,3-dioxygenase-like lactoylglutathione lyase family enzyme